MDTATLLTALETCERKGLWSRDWEAHRLSSTAILSRAIRAGLIESTRKDFGEVAGEEVMALGTDPGMEVVSGRDLYRSVIHHAALADTVTTALRRPEDAPWAIPSTLDHLVSPWASSAFLDPAGHTLRRVVLASSWSDARHYSEVRSWYGLGEVAMYRLPMTMAVVVLGQHRDGRRSGPWSKGFLHPQNHKLRFRKKSKVSSEVFSEKWQQVWREDRGEIETRDWLQGMLDDDILRDVCFTVDIPLPGEEMMRRIRGMAARKLERLQNMFEVPEPSLSVCDRPACPFKGCCWSEKEYAPSRQTGFLQLQPLPSVQKPARPALG